MTTTFTRSLRRAAVLSGAALLFSLAHPGSAAAQPVRYAGSCTAQSGDYPSAACQVTIPDGKLFVIESASVSGHIPSAQHVKVNLIAGFGGKSLTHTVPAGFQVLSNLWTRWSGALQGPIFARDGWVVFQFTRGPGNYPLWGNAQFTVTLSGYLEDI